MSARLTAHAWTVGPWLAAILLAIALLGGSLAFGGGDGVDAAFIGFVAAIGIWAVTQVTVGSLIASRRSDNRLGRLLQAGGVLIVSVFAGYVLAANRYLTDGPGDFLGGLAGLWASVMMFPALFLAFPLVGLVFPDGRLPAGRWRLPVGVIAFGLAGTSATHAIGTGPLATDLPNNPIGLVPVPESIVGIVGQTAIVLLLAAMGLAVMAIAGRWRRGGAAERAQLKWMLGALTVAGVLFPLTFSQDSTAAPDQAVLTILGVGSVTLIPVSIGIAVLRYRLYDIDRLISRTLAYGLVTAVLVAVLAAGNLALQTALAGITQAGTVAVAASTLAAFALFQPLRRRVQSAVDRRFDRARIDADRTVSAFAERLRGELDLASVTGDLRATADEAVRPLAAAVWLRGGVGRR